MTILRKYGVSATLDFDLFEVDGIDFRVDGVHASGDTKLMKDEGVEANTTNGFTDEGQGYSIVLTATEMQAARLVIYVVDQTATKVWLDRTVIIETYGHASAQHAMDFDDAVRGGMTALPNAAADAAGGLAISDAGGLDLDGVLSGNVPQTGDSFARIGVAGAGLTAINLPNQTMDITGNITGNLSGSVGSVTAAVTVGTNNDKTGYALSSVGDQSIADLILPPTNTAFPDIEFVFVAASDHVTPVTGATGTGVTRSIDGSAFGAGTGTLAEVGNGVYQYDASAADMNGKVITFRFTGTGGTPGAPDDAFVTLTTSK